MDYPAILSFGVGYSKGDVDFAMDYRYVDYENTPGFEYSPKNKNWGDIQLIPDYGYGFWNQKSKMRLIENGVTTIGIHGYDSKYKEMHGDGKNSQPNVAPVSIPSSNFNPNDFENVMSKETDPDLMTSYEIVKLPSKGLYYRSSQNLPWAINVVGGYAVPVEKAPINYGYLKFVDWAKSAGAQFSDWNIDLTGYRNSNYLNN